MNLKKVLDDLKEAIRHDGRIDRQERKHRQSQVDAFVALLKIYGERSDDPLWCELDALRIEDDVYPDHRWLPSIIPGMRSCGRCHTVEVKEVARVLQLIQP